MNSLRTLAIIATLTSTSLLATLGTGCASTADDAAESGGSAATEMSCTIPRELSLTEHSVMESKTGERLQVPQVFALHDFDAEGKRIPGTQNIISTKTTPDALYTLSFEERAGETHFTFRLDTWAGLKGSSHQVSGVRRGEKTLDVTSRSYFPGDELKELIIDEVKCEGGAFKSLSLKTPLYHLEFETDADGTVITDTVLGQQVPALKWVRTKDENNSTRRQLRDFVLPADG